MALSPPLLASILLIMLTVHLVDSQKLASQGPEAESPVGPSPILNCGGACQVRCSKSSRPNLCNRACGTCCARCNCVPSGTYGNEDSCPCYATMTTRGGARKCP